MPTEETIEELVDRILNKNIGPDEINKRRPKPFRYLTDAEEIKTELGLSNKNPISIMKNPNDLESIDNQLFQMGIGGNIKEIENILNKYRISRKFK